MLFLRHCEKNRDEAIDFRILKLFISVTMKQPCVYMLASKRNGTLYIGVTSDLSKRVWQHKTNEIEGFTKRYSVHHLVWYEVHSNMLSAITREKQLKSGSRQRKLDLIISLNPEWRDLYSGLFT